MHTTTMMIIGLGLILTSGIALYWLALGMSSSLDQYEEWDDEYDDSKK